MSDMEQSAAEAVVPPPSTPANGTAEHRPEPPVAAAARKAPNLIEHATVRLESMEKDWEEIVKVYGALLDTADGLRKRAESMGLVLPTRPGHGPAAEPVARPGIARTKGRPSTPPAAAKAAPAPKTAKQAGVKSSPPYRSPEKDRMPRRSPDQIKADLEKVVEACTGEELTNEQIQAKTGLKPKEMPRLLKEALDLKLLKKKGERRATKYSAK